MFVCVFAFGFTFFSLACYNDGAERIVHKVRPEGGTLIFLLVRPPFPKRSQP